MISYEWVVETLQPYVLEDGEIGEDIINCAHWDTYADALRHAKDDPAHETPFSYRIGLVRDRWTGEDGLQDRQWAYVVNGLLPDHFEDAMGNPGAKVPPRFWKAVEAQDYTRQAGPARLAKLLPRLG